MIVSKAHRMVLEGGMLIAYPEIDAKEHWLVIKIEGWSVKRAVPYVIDELPMPELGMWHSIHHIPARTLNSAFRLDMEELPEEGEYGYGRRFVNGGMYFLDNDWNYPLYGDRIGTLVKRLDRANQMPKSTGEPSIVVETPSGVTE